MAELVSFSLIFKSYFMLNNHCFVSFSYFILLYIEFLF